MSTPSEPLPALSNAKFAEDVGISVSFASRLRSGNRLPSAPLLITIIRVYRLDTNEALTRFAQGPAKFSEFLRHKVFRDEFQFEPGDDHSADDRDYSKLRKAQKHAAASLKV